MRQNGEMTDEKRLALVEEYLSSGKSRYAFEKEKGLSHKCISNWIRTFAVEDNAVVIMPQTAVTDMTNELLRKNAEALKIGTIQTAKEAERGIIDIETLVRTNQDLIDTINEVMTIQSEGRAKRIEAEKTLYNMEAELKKKLLSTNL